MEKMMTNSCRCLWGTLGYTQWLRPCTSVIQSVILDRQQPLRMYSCLIQRPGEIKPTQLVLQPTPTPAEAACQAAWLHHWQPQTQASRPVRAALRPICLCVHAFSCGEHECNCVLKWKKCSCVCVRESAHYMLLSLRQNIHLNYVRTVLESEADSHNFKGFNLVWRLMLELGLCWGQDRGLGLDNSCSKSINSLSIQVQMQTGFSQESVPGRNESSVARVVCCCWCDSGFQVTSCDPDLRRLGPEYTWTQERTYFNCFFAAWMNFTTGWTVESRKTWEALCWDDQPPPKQLAALGRRNLVAGHYIQD